MSVFSKFLKERIETMHVSVMHLSERLDTTSAVILKYMSGKELPQTVREVRRIGRSIPLSTPDQLALLESYYVTRYGANNYKCFQHISEMLRGIENYHLELSGEPKKIPFQMVSASGITTDLSGKPDFSNASTALQDREPILTGTGKLQTEYILTRFLAQIPLSENKQPISVRVLLQPDHTQFMKLLLLHTARPDVKVEQLICLKENPDDNGNLLEILPIMAFYRNKVNYHCKYYYDNAQSHINQMTFLPVMILLPDAVFLCNADLDSCSVIRNQTMVNYFSAYFDDVSRECDSLGISIPLFSPYHDFQLKSKSCGNSIEMFGYSPLFTLGMTRKILEDHLLLEGAARQSFIDLVDYEFTQLNRQCSLFHFFEKDALRVFLEQGAFPDYPPAEGFYRLPSLAVRLQIINNLIKLDRGNHITSHMTNHAFFHIQNKTQLLSNSVEGVVEIRCQPSGICTAVLMKEACLCNTLHQFGSFALDLNWFCSREETVEYMEALVKEYSAKL